MTAPLKESTLANFMDRLRIKQRRIPLQGTVETTFRCNLACVHCYVNKPAGDADEKARELPLARLKELIDEAVASGCLEVLFTGGEILIRPDFEELYLYAVNKGCW